jgi:hypothetical protein
MLGQDTEWYSAAHIAMAEGNRRGGTLEEGALDEKNDRPERSECFIANR